MRKVITLAVLAALLGLMALQSSPARAQTTRYVDDSDITPTPPGTGCADNAGYTTITAAVAAANPGDTIQVCPGTYIESVDVNKSLSILGTDWDSTILKPPGTTMGFRIMATDVLIKDFQINGQNGTSGDAGVHIFNGMDDARIEHNKILNLPSHGVFDNSSGPITDGIVLKDNVVDGTGAPLDSNGFFIGGNVSNITVEGNEIFGFRFIGLGPFLGDTTLPGWGAELVGSNTFQNNNIHNNGSAAIFYCHATGSVSIQGNELSMNGFYGIAASSTNPECVTTGSNTFEDNDIHDNGFAGIYYCHATGPVSIVGNDLTDNGSTGVLTGHPTDPDCVIAGADFQIHVNNIIQGTGYGVFNYEADTLDAECNWWGSPSGPIHPSNPTGTGAFVSDAVDFRPWLVARAPGGPCIGGLPSTPGKVTGGGKIEGSGDTGVDIVTELAALLIRRGSSNASVGHSASFGFSVTCCPPQGNLQYNDHDAGVQIKATSITSLVIGSGTCGPDSHAQFTGTATVNGTAESLQVQVDDCDEPGTADTFSIETDTYSASGVLISGNIQIHK